MIYTVVVIDHTARAVNYPCVSQKISGTSFKFCLVGYTGHCAYRNL